MSIAKACLHIIKRDLKLAIRQVNEVLSPLLFFIIVISLFPLAITSDPHVLQSIGPGLIWVAALLASLLAMPRLFFSDYLDGTLEQLILSKHPTSVLVFGKVIAHWCVTGLPLIIVMPLLALWLNLSMLSVKVLFFTLLLGTPILSLIGAIGTALTVGLRGGGLLLSLLLLPLTTPVLIFATMAVAAASQHVAFSGELALLGALLALSLSLAPFAAAAALTL